MKILLYEGRIHIAVLFILLLAKMFFIHIFFSFLAAPGDIKIHFIILLLILRLLYKISSNLIDFICPELLFIINKKGIFSFFHKNKYNVYWNNVSAIYYTNETEETQRKDEFMDDIPLLPTQLKISIMNWMEKHKMIEINGEQIHFKNEIIYIKIKDVNTHIQNQNFVKRNWLVLTSFLFKKNIEEEIKIDLSSFKKNDVISLKKQLKNIRMEYLKN